MPDREPDLVTSEDGTRYCPRCFGQVVPPGKVGCVCGWRPKVRALWPLLFAVAWVVPVVIVAVRNG